MKSSSVKEPQSTTKSEIIQSSVEPSRERVNSNLLGQHTFLKTWLEVGELARMVLHSSLQDRLHKPRRGAILHQGRVSFVQELLARFTGSLCREWREEGCVLAEDHDAL